MDEARSVIRKVLQVYDAANGGEDYLAGEIVKHLTTRGMICGEGMVCVKGESMAVFAGAIGRAKAFLPDDKIIDQAYGLMAQSDKTMIKAAKGE